MTAKRQSNNHSDATNAKAPGRPLATGKQPNRAQEVCSAFIFKEHYRFQHCDVNHGWRFSWARDHLPWSGKHWPLVLFSDEPHFRFYPDTSFENYMQPTIYGTLRASSHPKTKDDKLRKYIEG